MLATALLSLILCEGVLYSVYQILKPRLPRHVVQWQVIPNHNVVVAMTAYNDEASIYEAVHEFKSQPFVQEVVVVNNNSVDRTAELAGRAGARVVDESKQGYGYACIRGLTEALKFPKVNVVLLAEGDMTFDGKDLSKMIPYLDNVDMVVGTRTTRELTNEYSQMDWFYQWGNVLLAKMIQAKFFQIRHWGGIRLTDVGCTMRAIRAESLHRIVNKLSVGDNTFSPHMLMTAISSGLRLIEIPITFRRRWGVSKGAGSGKLKATGIGLKMMWHILAF